MMKENEEKNPDELNFEVDSALLSELGERLVGSVHVALLELVKNAYDADATLVKVRIEKVDKGIATSVVDNGVGMTLEDVQRYWMKIATNNKAIDCISRRYGRYKSGAKGIGRFSCRRLGDSLELKTTSTLYRLCCHNICSKFRTINKPVICAFCALDYYFTNNCSFFYFSLKFILF